jgi:hypothetical protein
MGPTKGDFLSPSIFKCICFKANVTLDVIINTFEKREKFSSRKYFCWAYKGMKINIPSIDGPN